MPELSRELEIIRDLARWDGPDAAPKRMHEIWQKVTRLIENEDWNNREPIADSGEALRWIPVEEKLPEHRTKVLVYREPPYSPAIQSASYWEVHSKGAGFYCGDEVKGITHWQTLPAAPEICQCEPPKSANDLGYVCPVHPVRDNKCKCICHQYGATICSYCEINHADSRPSQNTYSVADRQPKRQSKNCPKCGHSAAGANGICAVPGCACDYAREISRSHSRPSTEEK